MKDFFELYVADEPKVVPASNVAAIVDKSEVTTDEEVPIKEEDTISFTVKEWETIRTELKEELLKELGGVPDGNKEETIHDGGQDILNE